MSRNLEQEIKDFYDASSSLWENIWGEHMHHGYYGRNGRNKVPRRQAQIDIIEELLYWGNLHNPETPPQNILDVGCGIGGSTLYLAQKFNATAQGVTLSPEQAKRAQERATEVNLGERVQFQVANALNLPFSDESFDLIWSLESGEHFPDKAKFLQEAYRVLKPGGMLLMATWCHRPTDSLAGELTADEKRHLAEIYRVYCLPYVISLPEYRSIAQEVGFNNIIVDDWSQAVDPFWNIVIDSAFNPQAIMGLIESGWKTIEAALSLGLMSRGYRRGLIRFGVLQGIRKA
ncbi:methyltransferase domain-containing protein [Dactylococcopsis salina]|uniref:Methylase involved in ubiquinone/menaquinone biosynthesis n=1 Tax=Dactylococcopsis salina (strain PCC 8305) TaxID=13035 RepID=K9YTA0_DACS8|nr:methyltransferase domain-containing protein [Dactylococcopsis salina]AFZ50166.1 methylase involved in ubiquinone/menaquinone biosynthesis [Dactylococcopsis salina PCC 8305]